MRCSGQAILEFTAGLLVALVAAGWAGRLVLSEWRRVQCAHDVFEAVHSRVVGGVRVPSLGATWVEMEEDARGIRGKAQCGAIREEVALPLLESAVWE